MRHDFLLHLSTPRHETRASRPGSLAPSLFPRIGEDKDRYLRNENPRSVRGDQAQADPRSLRLHQLGGSAADKMAAPTAARLFAAEQRAAELEEESRS